MSEVALGVHALLAMATTTSNIVVDRCDDSSAVVLNIDGGYEVVNTALPVSNLTIVAQAAKRVPFTPDSTFGSATVTTSFGEGVGGYVAVDPGKSRVLMRATVGGVTVSCDGEVLYLDQGDAVLTRRAEAAVALEHAVVWYSAGFLHASTFDAVGSVASTVGVPYQPEGATALVLSGGDVWAVRNKCVLGLFSGLSGCGTASTESSRDVAATDHEIFLMDSRTGDVVGFPHSTLAAPALATFFARFADNGHEAPPLELVSPTPSLVGPRMAAQPLSLSGAESFFLTVANSALRRSVQYPWGQVRYDSPLPPQQGEAAFSHWAPLLCTPVRGLCGYPFYGSACADPRTICPRAAPLGDTEDTECEVVQLTVDSCPTRYSVSPLCPAGAIAYESACAVSCVPRTDCPPPHVFDASSNSCIFKGAVERGEFLYSAPAPPTCDPVAPPTPSTPTTPTTAAPTLPPTACEAGTYQPTFGGADCVLCKLCGRGQYMLAYCGSATRERAGNNSKCAACPKGTFQSASYHANTKCVPWNGCPGSDLPFRDGKCLNLSWLRDHWYISLHLAVVGYLIYGVRKA